MADNVDDVDSVADVVSDDDADGDVVSDDDDDVDAETVDDSVRDSVTECERDVVVVAVWVAESVTDRVCEWL